MESDHKTDTPPPHVQLIQMTTGAAVIAYALQVEFFQERETGHSNAAKLAERTFTFAL